MTTMSMGDGYLGDAYNTSFKLSLRTDFTQSIIGNPYFNMAWDMWIECTINKLNKMNSGWLSILKDEK